MVKLLPPPYNCNIMNNKDFFIQRYIRNYLRNFKAYAWQPVVFTSTPINCHLLSSVCLKPLSNISFQKQWLLRVRWWNEEFKNVKVFI